jgi:hypothetical protein
MAGGGRKPTFVGAPALLLAAALGSGGCQLDEVSVALPKDVLVAEAFVLVGDGEDQATAFLHWTLGTRPARDLVRASVVLLVNDTLEVSLEPDGEAECLMPGSADRVEGACFTASPGSEEAFAPGSRLELEVRLGDELELKGGSVIPQGMSVTRPRLPACALPPGRNLEITWTRSPGAWAYYAETTIWNLRRALEPMGIQAEADSIALVGLAISESDTTIAFPREFGIFNRGVLQQEVALALQQGLPPGAVAEVTVAALDRNWVNWVRGGSFNPSGTVRIPSLRGDGFGVLASAVRRNVAILGGFPTFTTPSCFRGF